MARRQRAEIAKQQAEILETLKGFPDGLQQTALLRAHQRRTRERIPLSTLGRRLDELETDGLVRRNHKRRNPTFRAVEPIQPVAGNVSSALQSPVWRATTHDEGRSESAPDIPLSTEAQAALSSVRLPRGKKKLVTYDFSFLDNYVPGRTWYLPQALRDHLRGIGTTAYAGQPAGTYARDIIQRLIIDLSWGSSRLEGNKYTRIDTEELIKGGREAEGASDTDRQMILNHKAAIEFLVEEAQNIDFNRSTILTLHALLAENLVERPEDEGRLRTRPVRIGDSAYTPTAIPQIIESQFDAILTKARDIPDAIEQAFFSMVHIPYLQPFLDANKRTSRLAANIPLIKENLCPLSFVDVPEQAYSEGTLAVYEQNDVALLRDVFAWAYERSGAQFMVLREAMGTPDPIRLNYRTQLRSVVSDVVEAQIWPNEQDLLRFAGEYGVPEADRAAFSAAALRDLNALRPDILARYRLRPNQFSNWLDAIGKARERVSADNT